MKKLFYFFIGSLAVSVGAGAKTITPLQATAIAADFNASESTVKSVPVRVSQQSRPDDAASPYYIYNYQGGGFVIVSGDDRFGVILAYDKNGEIDMSVAPDGLKDLLNMYSAAYNALPGDDDNTGSQLMAVPVAVVEPLLGEVAWGQDVPFNTMTPLSTAGKNFYTGCVACASTQIMRYHSYPARGQGSKTYTDPLSKNTLTADFGSTTYDWSNMPSRVPDAPTDAQTKAYSTLASHFGIAVEMQYEASGSGTYDMLVPYALRNYFGYDKALRGHLRSYYSTSEWMSMIKDEISAGRPVFYGGTSDTGSGGHAFVLDGYDSQDFVHVNWGWYGRSNGYFRINHLDPSSLGEGGGAGGYNLGQDMVTGIRPALADSKRDYAIYGESRLNIDGPFGDSFTMMTFLGNIDVEPFSGRVEGALIKDGQVIATLGGEDVAVAGFKNGHSGSYLLTLRNVASKVSGIADGEYDMCLVYKGADSDGWSVLRHPAGLPSYCMATVKSGAITIGERHTPYPDVVQHSAIVTDGDFYAGGYGRATFAIESMTGDYNLSELTMRLTAIDNPADVYDANVSVSIYNQSVETVDVTFPISADITAGRYTLTGLVKTDGKEYPFDLNGYKESEVKVLAAPAGPVARLVGTPSWQVNNASASVADRLAQGEYLYVTGYFRNAGAPGKAKIEARLTDTATGERTHMIMTEPNFVDEKAVAVTFARQIANDPGTYSVDFAQVGDDYSMTDIVSLDEPVYVTVDPSDIIVADVTKFEFPDRIAKAERVPYSLEAVARQTVTKTLYFRVRQLSNKSGEIVNMKSGTRFVEGQSVAMSGNYRPSASLDDGLYMVILEAGTTGQAVPLGNYPLYAKTVAIGDVNSVDLIEAAQNAVAIWLDGTMLRVVPADGSEVKSVEVYATTGVLAAVDRYDLSHLNSGVYIVSVTLANGSRSIAKIALK